MLYKRKSHKQSTAERLKVKNKLMYVLKKVTKL